MNIPTIKTTAPFPYCREFASSPVAIDPSHSRGIELREGKLDFEFACFLIDWGRVDLNEYDSWQLKKKDYVEMILEDERTHAEIESRIVKAVGNIEVDELTYKIYEIQYKAELNELIETQTKVSHCWADFE
ncbi:MAG TPA: hypothetical protein VLA13_10040 [Massilibacterium sp.]|nr:hypothetical protein [Massilibacterium sp.]